MAASRFFLDHPSIDFTPAGELMLAGRPVSALIAEFGSPLVVMLEDVIRANCRRYRSRLETYPRSRIYFASKAFLTTGFCRLLMQEGLGLDVVSAGELHTALAAGFPPEDMVMHGNAKTEDELRAALAAGVGRIVVDNFEDIERLGQLVGAKPASPATRNATTQGAAGFARTGTVKLHLRIAPGVKPDTHEYIQTGQIDSKFGFNREGESIFEAARRIAAIPGVELVGLHCHIGSQILDDASFIAAARVMMQVYAALKHELGVPLDELNLGGGIGIRYQPGDSAPQIEEHLRRLTSALTQLSAELNVEPPVLCDEPGRSIVGEAGVTLYTVQSIKRIPDVRNYAGLDGGMTDNPRFALYGARHYAMRASNAPEAIGSIGEELWSLSGKCCETGDMLIKDTPLPALAPGDVVALFSTGAYTYTMASNYNRVPRPADVARLDEVPAWLS
jgi:diaminopimelate decarboxylase